MTNNPNMIGGGAGRGIGVSSKQKKVRPKKSKYIFPIISAYINFKFLAPVAHYSCLTYSDALTYSEVFRFYLLNKVSAKYTPGHFCQHLTNEATYSNGFVSL